MAEEDAEHREKIRSRIDDIVEDIFRVDDSDGHVELPEEPGKWKRRFERMEMML